MNGRPAPFYPPPNIFGSLFLTPGGRTILRDIIQLQSMCSMMEDQEESLQNRRAVLWSLAHIAVQPKGTLFLKVVFSFPPHLQNQGRFPSCSR